MLEELMEGRSDDNPRPAVRRKVNLITACDESPCVCHVSQVAYSHEDEPMRLVMSPEEADDLEQYELSCNRDRLQEILAHA
jgi:hypothetical protein